MKRSHGRFEPKMCINGKTVGLGWCDTEEEAIEVYKNEKKKKKKKKLIDKVAKEYFNKGLISERIYKAFLNYKVVYG